MKPKTLWIFRCLCFFAIVKAILLFADSAMAGPPLICHAFEIGNAKSLPLDGHSWNLSGSENYDTKNLASDTLAILTPDTPVLVRMETLRRATLYARKDPIAAKELLARLHARATAAESAGHAGSDDFEFAAPPVTSRQGTASDQSPDGP